MNPQFGEPQPPPYSTVPRPGQKTVETGNYPASGVPPTAPPFAAYPPQGAPPGTYQGMSQYPPPQGYYPGGYPQGPPPPGAYPPQQGYGPAQPPPPPGYYQPQNPPYGQQPQYVYQEYHQERRDSRESDNCCLYAFCAGCLACCFLDALVD